jgi:omega-6 fatty acid desaturase (delta-12 desaturase)
MAVTDLSAHTPAGRDPDADGKPGRGSLKPVLDVIPPEAYHNPTWRGLGYVARDTVLYLAAVALLVAIPNPLVALPLVAFASLVIAGLFVIAHDAAHGALFGSKPLNALVGRLAMLPSWHVYEGWVLGHKRLRHRIEWSWWGAGAYYLREVWWNKMIVGRPPARWRAAVRRDRILVGAVVGAAAVALAWAGWQQGDGPLGAAWMVARVLVLPFLGFSFIIGSFVHVHHVQPDIRWWPRREWNKFRGQMEGTTVLRAPAGLNFFVHWIMVHVPHHVDVRIPMYNLELATEAIEVAFPGTVHDAPLRFRDFVANTRTCKLYDFDEGRWFTYAEAERLVEAERRVDAEPPPSSPVR